MGESPEVPLRGQRNTNEPWSREEPRGAARRREEPRRAARSREEARGAATSREEARGAARSRKELRKGTMRRSHKQPRGARHEPHGSSHDNNASSQWEGCCVSGYIRARPSDARSIHCCQLVNSITFDSWSIRFEEHPPLATKQPSVPRASSSRNTHQCQLNNVRFLEHAVREASNAANTTTFGSWRIRCKEHSITAAANSTTFGS